MHSDGSPEPSGSTLFAFRVQLRGPPEKVEVSPVWRAPVSTTTGRVSGRIVMRQPPIDTPK
jgi:hypothetical protein